MTALTARAVTVEVVGGRRLLEAVSVSLPAGRLTGIIGPNGAGKSTLLRVLAGVMAPAAGTFAHAGRPLPRPGSRARARLIGFLPQGHAIHWPLTVRRTVALGRLPHLLTWQSRLGPADEAAVAAALDRTSTAALADATVETLSGGERARVMLARVLVTETPVLLADEPAAALDPRHQLAVMGLLREEAHGAGRAVAVVLHDLSLAARYCDDLILLAEGRVVAAGETAAVLASPALEEAYGVRFARSRVDGAAVVTALEPHAPPAGVAAQ